MLKNWGVKMLCIGLIGLVVFAIPELCQAQGARIDLLIKQMERTNETARKKLIRVMKRAARLAGVHIQTSGLGYVSTDDGTMVAIPIAGAESLRMEDLERGANITYVHIDSPIFRDIVTPNFYTVNVSKDSVSGEWVGKLLDQFGNVAGMFDSVEVGEVEVVPPPIGAEGAKVEASVNLEKWPKETDKKRVKLHQHAAVYENRPPLEPIHTRTWMWFTKESE